jgi:hypothetical protein
MWRRNAWRCLIGTGGLVAALVLALPEEGGASLLRELMAFHLVLAGVLVVGAAFDDALGRWLRVVGAALVLAACLVALSGLPDPPAGLPVWAVGAYPPVMATLLAGYGLLLRHRPSLAVAALVLAGCLAGAAWRGYWSLRQVVTGLDHLALSMALFALAVLISLAKSGVLSRWVAARGGTIPHPAGLPEELGPGLGHGSGREGDAANPDAIQQQETRLLPNDP